MRTTMPNTPIDYLLIGHLTRDITPEGNRLGGTAAYASLTALALGARVGVISSWGSDLPAGMDEAVSITGIPAEHSTTFENQETAQGRVQYIRSVAEPLDLHLIPDAWIETPIVHIGPVAQEIPPSILRHFPNAFIGITAQGWLRAWDERGRVSTTDWPEAQYVMGLADAVVISQEDLDNDETSIQDWIHSSRLLVVTSGANGASLYIKGDQHQISAPKKDELDATGAGDIFAAAFFLHVYHQGDPLEAARFATRIAADSVIHEGIAGVPVQGEIQPIMARVN